MKRVICIIQARMGSERLPEKVLRPVMGQPLLGYSINRLSRCKNVDQVIVATSILNQDNAIDEFVKGFGYECFRGSEDNVLSRYVMANRKYGGDIVIRVTGDCPLIAPELVDFTVDAFLAAGKDYVSLNPHSFSVNGFDTEIFSKEALERTYETVCGLSDFKNYKEHVTIYMYRHPDEFSIGSAKYDINAKRPYRLSVDEINDFKVVEAIFEHFKNPYPTASEIIEFLDNNSEIADLNIDVQQKDS